jgi:hypothetical protein
VDCSLLVTHVDDPDALVETTVVEGHDVAAGKGEDDLDAGFLERLRRELSAMQRHFADPRGWFGGERRYHRDRWVANGRPRRFERCSPGG